MDEKRVSYRKFTEQRTAKEKAQEAVDTSTDRLMREQEAGLKEAERRMGRDG